MEKNIQTMGDHLLKLFVVMIGLVVVMNTHQVHGDAVPDSPWRNITFVTDAAAKGAVCLDGSPAAYYLAAGSGEGVNKWNIHILGGGWCADDTECAARFLKYTGSSLHNDYRKMFTRKDQDFVTWNRVSIVYCDSSSLMGLNDHPVANITGRGARIFDAVMGELSQKGLTRATEVLFTGGSAGGLAVLFHCDGFRALLPQSSRVKCISDSGFFIHAPKLHGAEKRANWFANVAAYHGFTNNLPSSCRSRMSNSSLCMFPEYFIKDIQTPLFLIESKFDQYQMGAHYLRDDTLPFENCTKSLELCTPDMLESMKDYGVALTEQMQNLRDTTSIGMFVQPCTTHGHSWCTDYRMRDKNIRQATLDWFYDRDNSFQEIDYVHEYPQVCPSCPPTMRLP